MHTHTTTPKYLRTSASRIWYACIGTSSVRRGIKRWLLRARNGTCSELVHASLEWERSNSSKLADEHAQLTTAFNCKTTEFHKAKMAELQSAVQARIAPYAVALFRNELLRAREYRVDTMPSGAGAAAVILATEKGQVRYAVVKHVEGRERWIPFDPLTMTWGPCPCRVHVPLRIQCVHLSVILTAEKGPGKAFDLRYFASRWIVPRIAPKEMRFSGGECTSYSTAGGS